MNPFLLKFERGYYEAIPLMSLEMPVSPIHIDWSASSSDITALHHSSCSAITQNANVSVGVCLEAQDALDRGCSAQVLGGFCSAEACASCLACSGAPSPIFHFASRVVCDSETGMVDADGEDANSDGDKERGDGIPLPDGRVLLPPSLADELSEDEYARRLDEYCTAMDKYSERLAAKSEGGLPRWTAPPMSQALIDGFSTLQALLG